jgi:hypothetical protein
MSFANIWNVRAKGSGADVMQDGSGAIPTGWIQIPVYAAGPGGLAKSIMVRTGTGSFAGSGTGTVQTSVAHGLPKVPDWVDIFPALTSSGTPWGAMTYQTAAADGTSFYVAAFTNAGTFGLPVYYFNWLAIALMMT